MLIDRDGLNFSLIGHKKFVPHIVAVYHEISPFLSIFLGINAYLNACMNTKGDTRDLWAVLK